MNLWFDLKYAFRLFLKSPGHSLLCVVVVGLSVGLAVWTSTLAYSQAFRPLPFPGSDRWYSVQVAADATARPRPNIDAFTYQELLKRNRTVNHLGAFTSRAAVLSEGQASTSLRGVAISPPLLAAMKVAPVMGRLFDIADGHAGATPRVILSFNTWQSYFASDPAIVGKQARIDGQPMQIAGVLPKEFLAFEDFEIWLPLQLPQIARPNESTVTVNALVILEDDQRIAAALNEMKTAVDEVNASYPDRFNAGRHILIIPGHRIFSQNNLEVVATVSFLAVAVLLLGGVNISMVFLARLLERSRELAVRTALGASRTRLLRQCLLETSLIVVLGLLLGWGLAALGVNWTETLGEYVGRIEATGRSEDGPQLRSTDLLTAVVAATVLWLLSTLIPAWRIAKQDAAEVLAGSGKGAAGPRSAKGASVLVGLQVIVSCLVLVICANLVIAIRDEVGKPTGLNTERVMLSTYPTVFDARYSEAAGRLRYWDELTAMIKSRVAGAEVTYANAIPTRAATTAVAIENQQGAADQGTLRLPLAAVSDNYFELLGLDRRAGRLFDNTDNSTSLGVAIVDEVTAERYWPGQNAVGKRIRLNPAENGPWLTVVGVVAGIGRPYFRDRGAIYQPLRQAAPSTFHLMARMPNAAANHRAALRAAAFAIDRDLPLHNLQRLDEYLESRSINYTALVPVFSVITAITVILAASGLYGLISRAVAQRTQEVGVRRALGGTQWQVTSVFLRQGAIYLIIGVIGGGVGILATNFLATSIPNILNRAVPATLGVLVLITLVIFTASYLPARRAVALEPGDALRHE